MGSLSVEVLNDLREIVKLENLASRAMSYVAAYRRIDVPIREFILEVARNVVVRSLTPVTLPQLSAV